MNIDELKKIYPIQTWINNPILRKKSKEIKNITNEIREFAKVLKILMYEYDWVGLAAPQIWNNVRMIAVTKWDIKGDKYNFIEDKIMINPEIIWTSEEMEIDEEWCLSVPGIVWNVKRYKSIIVKYQDEKWNVKEEKLEWFNARIVQHEIDHLNGILFVDKMLEKNKLNIKNFISNKID